MSKIARFAEYASAFEKAFETDDWSLVEPYFTDDAVYEARLPSPFGGRFEGRKAVLEYFKWVVDRLDRHFETRELALVDGPTEEGDRVWLRGTASYRAPDVPEFVLELEEIIHFQGDRIRLLEDRYEPEMTAAFAAYLSEHGDKVGITIDA